MPKIEMPKLPKMSKIEDVNHFIILNTVKKINLT